jgi:hypothetical protein
MTGTSGLWWFWRQPGPKLGGCYPIAVRGEACGCHAHAAVSDVGPWLGIDWGGKAEGANGGGGVGDAEEVGGSGRKLDAADGAGLSLEDVIAGVSESECEKQRQQPGCAHLCNDTR